MAPQNYYQLNAVLAARDALEPTTASSINAKSIALIIFVAIVPVLLVAGAVSWLLCCYSRGSGCGRRKKDQEVAGASPKKPARSTKTPAGQKPVQPPMSQTAPSRPAPVLSRNGSGMSKSSKSSAKHYNERTPTLPQGFV